MTVLLSGLTMTGVLNFLLLNNHKHIACCSESKPSANVAHHDIKCTYRKLVSYMA